MGQIFFFFKVRVSIRTCVPNLGPVRRERFLTIDNPLNPPWVGWVKKNVRVRVSIRTCVPNLGEVRRSCPEISKWSIAATHTATNAQNHKNTQTSSPHHSHIGSLNPPGVGWVKCFFFLRWEYLSAHACTISARSDGRFEKKWLSNLFLGYIYLHVFLYIVRSTMEIRWSLSDFLLVLPFL